MDSNTKLRKGFIKGKLAMSFYRASKPSTTMQPYTTATTKGVNMGSHVKPLPASQKSEKTTPPSSLIMNQEKVNSLPPYKRKVSYVIPRATAGTYGVFDSNPYGVVVDEGVDDKASSYILCVQERFKLEHVGNDQLVEPTS